MRLIISSLENTWSLPRVSVSSLRLQNPPLSQNELPDCTFTGELHSCPTATNKVEIISICPFSKAESLQTLNM
jgi:hypothetical protein